ncbi:Rna polymerase ii c-terminal domain phosphatase-like [Thalictrum thalictroides]|uniref:protein-serine/threonine phosphatase n=1 Tax=Thalictrum thalictroides TaxID=46969 RepID=A0A7J6WGG1_THATH|nr:Rna polymerase ii c-terminal domain phosphatase-like [Thalictrum thalictroides]
MHILGVGMDKRARQASQLYELHLFTTWNKKLAADFEKNIDPSGALFGGRIICFGEPSKNVCWYNTTKRVQKNLDEVKGLESAVIIMDICEDSWPHNKHNLVLVERNTYFPSKELHIRHKAQSLLKCDLDERVEDGTLASTLVVRLFYIVNVKNSIAYPQKFSMILNIGS